MASTLPSTPSPPVADVGREQFRTLVLERSHEIPVLVDFWAPWCGPCRVLTPVLTKLAEEYGGKFFLAKVNTDAEQELATEYQIRGIPAIKLFRHGEVVGELVGVQPEPALRALIDPFIAREADAIIERARALDGAGKKAEALELLRQAVERDPTYDKAKIALARQLIESPGDTNELPARVDEAERLLNSLSMRAGTSPEVEALRAKLTLLRIVADAPPADALERTVAAKPDDHEARYRLAAHLALQGRYEDAMRHLLEIVQRDRAFGDDAARKALLAVFSLAGSREPLVVKYRGLLARALN